VTEEISLPRRLLAEAIGSAFLLTTVVGSGVMGDRLSGGNAALALLANALATGAILIVLITMLGPISGAHFNPAVSMGFVLRRELRWLDAAAYTIVQIAGAIIGVWCAHLMFDLPVFQVSSKIRFGPGQWFSEFVAAFGLGLTIFGCLHCARAAVPTAVGLYIMAAYWFTASTSFANPAVTLARALSDTFAGVAPNGIAPFIVGQVLGLLAAVWVSRTLWPQVRI
jgi:glycerol uptake facilitator-like aquaporin